MTETNYQYVDLAELYVEMHKESGNFNKFEVHDHENDKWIEVDVWQYRKADDTLWIAGQQYFAAVEFLSDIHTPEDAVFRVTHFPELEKETLDTTYHPSVDLQKINLNYVRNFLNG